MAKEKPLSRIDKFKSLPPSTRTAKRCFFDALSAEIQSELSDFRRRFHAGEFSGRRELDIYEFWKDELKDGLPVQRGAFFNWLKRKDESG